MDTDKPARRRTRLGRGIRKAMDVCGYTFASDAAQAWGVSAFVLRHWMTQEEPSWLRSLRAIKRLTGLSWDELLDGRRAGGNDADAV